MANEIITADGEIISDVPAVLTDVSAVSALARAEIDGQIATARAYPRSMARAKQQIMSYVTLDEDTAETCIYSLPRSGKPITGPSIRFAEIVQQCWGNNRTAARITSVDRVNKFVEAEGIYHDLETNSARKATVRRRIVDSKGRLYSDDMIIVTGNAACSIALRNAILAGVPRAIWGQAEDAARKAMAGSIETLSVTREKSIAAFARFGVTPDHVFGALGLNGADEVTLEHIVVMRGMFSAIKNGEATVEEIFTPAPAAEADNRKSIPAGLAAKMASLANGSKKDAPADQQQAHTEPAPSVSSSSPGKVERAEDRRADAGEPEAVTAAEAPPPDKAAGHSEAPASDPIKAAYEAGWRAAESGAKRSAPRELRSADREREYDAWIDGYENFEAGRAS